MRIETMKEMDGTGEGQPVPKTASEAAAFFRCAVLACSMMGARCATNYADACAGSAARVSCRGCPAGRAREALLRGVSASERAVSPALALPMPPRRRCEDCGMDMGSNRHTLTSCRRASEALRAAVSGGVATQRAADRAAHAERVRADKARAEEARRQKSALAKAERAEAKRIQREAREAERIAARLARGEPKESRRARQRAKRQALIDAGLPVGSTKRCCAETKRRVDIAERAGMICPRIGCGNPASQSRIGPWCKRCINSARMCLRRRPGGDTPENIAQWLTDRPSMAKPRTDWSAVPDLGKVPDRELARRIGVSPVAVRHAREARGIPLCQRGQRRTAREVSPCAGRMTPDSVRDERGCIVWTMVDWSVGSDANIAAAIGSNMSTVRAARERLGIDSARKRGAVPPRIDWSTVPLGTMSDRDIARMTGTNRQTVQHARERLGIPPFGRWGVRKDEEARGEEVAP